MKSEKSKLLFSAATPLPSKGRGKGVGYLSHTESTEITEKPLQEREKSFPLGEDLGEALEGIGVGYLSHTENRKRKPQKCHLRRSEKWRTQLSHVIIANHIHLILSDIIKHKDTKTRRATPRNWRHKAFRQDLCVFFGRGYYFVTLSLCVWLSYYRRYASLHAKVEYLTYNCHVIAH